MNGFIRLMFIASLGMSTMIMQPYRIEISRQLMMQLPTELSVSVPQSVAHESGHSLLNQQEFSYEMNEKLTCLNHEPSVMNETSKPGSDPSKTILEHQSANRCGHLRRNWLRNPPLSDLAKEIESHQSNCSLPLATHNFDNTFGLGSHIILWGQALCNGMETRYRMRSHEPEWLWLDQEHCDMQEQANLSPMLCYFPASEYRCSDLHQTTHVTGKKEDSSSTMTAKNSSDVAVSLNITDPREQKHWCELAKESEESRAMIRAASTEYLFQSLSPLVVREAKRQIGIIFPNGIIPEDLVTVHVRWGDKFWEMDLPPIQEYITAVNTILSGKSGTLDGNTTTTAIATTANIYLATEDPKAYQEFMAAKPHGWNVYADITLLEINAFRPPKGNRASWAARNTNGRAGLVALASLLVAMESNMFVLTTKSNWSTIMNHLRTNIVNPRCGNCTKMIDLRPGMW
jgi:hypothetical protein